jgi:protein kinase A
MPSLGFLKKKRTKDSSEPKEQDGPTSPIKAQSNRPDSSTTANSAPKAATTTPTPSAGAATGVKSAQQDSAVGPDGQVEATDEAMMSASPQSHGVATTTSPSIQNLLNADEKSANGGVVAVPAQPRTTKGKYTLPDFTIQRTLGTGSFGRVHLVQSKHNQRYYAIKVLKKAQVVKMKQVEHTNDERRMLQAVKHPFLITLWGTFQDSKNLYMVMDFVEGGELFSLLRKSQVRA